MMLQLQRKAVPLCGSIQLSGSKSISNRALVIQALCDSPFEISHLADAKDTTTLQALLQSEAEILDAGAAGTTFRFLTALLAMREGTQILTGSERMKQRPIGGLVDALRRLGADISYLDNEGFPPLRIGAPRKADIPEVLKVAAGASSQFVSALLMIAPVLPGGLTLELDGPVVSKPYIEMTLQLMGYFGVSSHWENNRIHIRPQKYQGRDFRVEADWSAASYYYSMAAIAPEADLYLEGLFEHSAQGDAVLASMMEAFGVRTTFGANGVSLRKTAEAKIPTVFEYDFLPCPDLAQTLAVTCGALGVTGLFTGLETLRVKETDRVAALQQELQKVGVHFVELPAGLSRKSGKLHFLLEGKAGFPTLPVFDTYEDHRMAMAFAPLALCAPIAIRNPEVVEKSYPGFWADLERLDFQVGEGTTSLV